MYRVINTKIEEVSQDIGYFHACLTDPPYHLTSIVKRFGGENSSPAKFGKDGAFARASKGFMGQVWDGGDVAFREETWQKIGGFLHPGAFTMAFASARGYARMAVAIEDAGFEMHPSLFLWNFSSGFPKATRIDNQVVRRGLDGEMWTGYRYGKQALKPAIEPIICAQKPYFDSPVEVMINLGSGALNIDGGRVNERYPANLVLSHMQGCKVVGEKWVEGYQINRWKDDAHPFGNGAGNEFETESIPGHFEDVYECEEGCPVEKMKADASFYHCSDFSYEVEEKILESDNCVTVKKPDHYERSAGLEENNPHPTLKPIALAKYLATLLLPPKEFAPRRILVPFSGAGSEMIGCMLAGWEEVVGIEMTPEYVETANKRLAFWDSWIQAGEKDIRKISRNPAYKQLGLLGG